MISLRKPALRRGILYPLLLHLSILALFAPCGHDGAAATSSWQEAKIVAVNDGDTVTIVMNNRKYRTRLIGFDAPEMGQKPWGRRSREHLRMLLKKAKWRVFVETDVEKKDKYHRLLVYLWTENHTLLNEKMILDGYAVLFTIPPNVKYASRFRKAQRAARNKGIGIWGQDGLKERPLEYKKTHPRTKR